MEQTIEKRNWNLLYNVFATLFILSLVFIGIQFFVEHSEKPEADLFLYTFFSMNSGELLVAWGTAFLAIVTAYLAIKTSEESKTSRTLTIDENRKARRKDQLIRQLDFYSKLKGEIVYNPNLDIKGRFYNFKVDIDSVEAKWNYELWCETGLGDLFRTYFTSIEPKMHKYDHDEMGKSEKEIFEREADGVIVSIIGKVKTDFDNLKTEYLNL